MELGTRNGALKFLLSTTKYLLPLTHWLKIFPEDDQQARYLWMTESDARRWRSTFLYVLYIWIFWMRYVDKTNLHPDKVGRFLTNSFHEFFFFCILRYISASTYIHWDLSRKNLVKLVNILLKKNDLMGIRSVREMYQCAVQWGAMQAFICIQWVIFLS